MGTVGKDPVEDIGPIPIGDRTNFDTLVRAAKIGNLMAVSAKRLSDGKQVTLVCAAGKDGNEIVVTPLAVMIEGNPYEDFIPGLDSKT